MSTSEFFCGFDELTKEYRCEECGYSNDRKSQYEMHLLTLKHNKINCNTNKIDNPEIIQAYNEETKRYECIKCGYYAKFKSHYERHLLSLKHKSGKVDSSEIIQAYNEETSQYECKKCNFSAKYKSNYEAHMKRTTHVLDKISKIDDSELIKGYNEETSEYGCEKCGFFSQSKSLYETHLLTSKHILSEEELKIKLSENGKNCILDGDKVELFTVDILKTLDFEDVNHQGHTGNNFDVFIKYKNEDKYRGLQIKTLSLKKVNVYGINSFEVKINNCRYENDTLIVAVNLEFNKYALVFVRDLNNKSISLTKNNSNKLYDDLELFKKDLFILAKQSTICNNFNDYLTDSQIKECESLERFKIKCDLHQIPFARNNTNTNEIDGTANNYNLQFKCSTFKSKNRYSFQLSRNSGRIKRPYNLEDKVDFFIFETSSEEDKDNFYIIPKEILIQGQYIKNEEIKGKMCIGLPIPKSREKHWSIEFLNNFELLKSDIHKQIVVFYDSLHEICHYNNIKCEFNSKNKIRSINNHTLRHIQSSGYGNKSLNFDLRIHTSINWRQIKLEDGYEFLIFNLEKWQKYCFLIIPFSILIEKGYIKNETNEGVTTINVPLHDPNNPFWAWNYYNRFDLLLKDI